jgi:hypothetical protein
MQFSASRAFSDAFGMFTRKFGPMFAVTLIYIVAAIAMFAVFGGSLMAMFASQMGGLGGGGAIDPSSTPAIGAGMIGSIILFYIAFYALQFAHQSALCRLCSDRHDASIGEAIGAGLRSVPTLLGVVVLMVIAGMIGGIVLGIVMGILAAVAQSPAVSVIGGIAMLVFFIWLAARLCTLLPVVANDEVRNPITAIGRAWRMTSGSAAQLALLFLGVFVAMGAVFGVAFFATIGIPSPGNIPAMGSLVTFGILMLVLGLSVGLYFVALVAAIHNQLSDTSVEAMSDTFA